ncbi:hypothetical protein BDN67DRAFT_969195 [Paxillus ammoniavirescens]|nr:hypothetical protein BDN67DRAFT_969195 [Paxillus ammoniavirescens]
MPTFHRECPWHVPSPLVRQPGHMMDLELTCRHRRCEVSRLILSTNSETRRWKLIATSSPSLVFASFEG